MSRQYGNITIEEAVDLANFTDTTGENLYFKIDGNIATTNPDGSRPNIEFRTIDGGVKWHYTNNRGWQPYGEIQPIDADYYINYILSNAVGGLGVLNYNIEYEEDNGSIALYVDGILAGSADNLTTLNNLIQSVYISIDPAITTGSLTIDTNLPILDLTDYVESGSLENRDIWRSYGIPEGAYDNYGYPPAEIVQQITLNYLKGYIEDDTYKYYMYNTYASGNGTFDGFEKTGTDVIRNENIYAQEGNNLALYYTSTDNGLTLVYNTNVIRQVYYSNGGEFYDNGKNIAYTNFFNYWQGRLGTTYGASRVETNIPIFGTQADALGYLGGTVDISKAINFDDISGGINPTNKTGLKEISTEFSDTYHTSVFGIQLACNISALRDIANVIYSDIGTIWDNVKKGLEMYGENVMDAIIDLTYYPFDITSVVSGTVSQNYINFGKYRAELSHTIHRIVYSNGYIDAGSVNFLPTYKNWIDYAHTGLQVYLPYIGMKTLDPAHYMGKSINVRYYFDFHSRGCTACIIADGVLMDYFNGQIGIAQPINSRDFASYAESVINNTLELANPAGTVVSDVVGGLAREGGIGSANAVGLGISAGISIDSVLAEGAYEYATNHAKVQSKGSVGSDTGGHLPQYVFFKFTYEEPITPSNLLQLYGKPSNSGGAVSSFGGFLKCSSVKLECNRATAKERDEIKSLLRSGIYI